MDKTILIIAEANDSLVQQLQRLGSRLDVDVQHATTIKEAKARIDAKPPTLILCDHAAFHEIRAELPWACVILYANESNSEQAIDAIKHGALEYLVKPLTDDALLDHIHNALRVSQDVEIPTIYESDEKERLVNRIVGQSASMNEVYKQVGNIAPQDINVLITGESGTGKELIARAILQHSPRKDHSYLAVNCAAIPETLLESELFGHEKGAFTGADTRRIGKFEQCHTGTLFLDEIGDIPPSTQTKLLRVLQDNTIQRLGGLNEIKCDVRIIAATHQPLRQLISERRFREDLFYRLNVATIHVPPLRERDIDAIVLAHYFVHKYNHQFSTHIKSFAPDVLPALLQYHWPGNVRELENTIKSSLVSARGSTFRLEFLPEHIRQRAAVPSERASGDAIGADELARKVAEQLAKQTHLAGDLHGTAVRLIERAIVCAALEATGSQLNAAAKLLGISRTTLRKKMQQLGISVKSSPRTDSR